MQIQTQKMDLNKIADKLQNEGSLEIYWDYTDSLNEQQILKIIKEKEGLFDVQDEIYENCLDYIYQTIREAIQRKVNTDELSYDEYHELINLCQDRFDFNIDDLIRRSRINLRIELMTNEDLIQVSDGIDNETLKFFRKTFKNCFRIDDLKTEINNMMGSDYGLITFYFKVEGINILNLREQVQKGKITLKKGLQFGIFNSSVGAGSLLEITLTRDIVLYLKDWRIRNDKEELVNALGENDILPCPKGQGI